MMHDEVKDAFERVYLDLCCHGLCRYDPEILARLWDDFFREMQRGFDSLFPAKQ
jgi:hypothetical protein